MDFYPGDTVVLHDNQVGTVLEPAGAGRGYLEYSYPDRSSRGRHGVKAYPVLLDGGEIRVFVASALRLPGQPE